MVNEAQSDDADGVLERMVRVINDGWLVSVLSLGERTHLNSALSERPQTVAEIAQAAGCDERYTEVWLWAMAAGRFVMVSEEVEPHRFAFVPGAAKVLTDAGGAEHWARISKQITALAALEDYLVAAFHTGAGLPAEAFEGRIVEVLSAESDPIVATTVLDEIVPQYGLESHFGSGAQIADLGCGTGTLVNQIAARYPETTVVGIDQSADALAAGIRFARSESLTNATFICADLSDDLPVDELSVAFAINSAHDLPDPLRFFASVHDALVVGGVFYLVELASSTDMRKNIENPHALGILGFSLYHCLPLAKRRPGIAPSGMYGTDRYVEALREVGFTHVSVTKAPSDPTNDTIIAIKGTQE